MDKTVWAGFWVPAEIAKNLAIPGGEAPEDLHLTLAFMGEREEYGDDEIRAVTKAIAKTANEHGPIQCEINTVEVLKSEQGGIVYAGLDGGDLPQFRQDLAAAIEDAGVEEIPLDGQPYIVLKHFSATDPEPDVDEILKSVTAETVEFPILEFMAGDDQRLYVLENSTELIEKFNPHHDARGRFSSADNSAFFSLPKNPAHRAKAIAAESARTAALEAAGKIPPLTKPVAPKPKRTPKPKAPKPPKPTPAVDKPGVTTKWNKMTDDEFVAALDTRMRGAKDIHQEVVKKYGRGVSDWVDTGDGGDRALIEIYKSRGFHGKPKMADTDEIDNYIKTNNTAELYRGARRSSSGLSGREKTDNFLNDDTHYAGLGVYGNGTYAGETPKNPPKKTHWWNRSGNVGLGVAQAYSNGEREAIIKMTLDKGAKKANYATLYNEHKEFKRSLAHAWNNGKISDDDYNAYRRLTDDVGRYAALRGYDAFKATDSRHGGASTSEPYWVILNRGKLIVQKERLS